MKARGVLITQCLQNDFVKPIGRNDLLPNRLHVGFSEARRLMGDRPDEGPVATLLHWAYRRRPEDLEIIHIRDWHSASDAGQKQHLEQFGAHCMEGSPGADHAFSIPTDAVNRAEEVRSLSLNDFQDTRLEALLAPRAGSTVPVGIVGVWTEAKVLFLAYELVTRYPSCRIAVCSALTASSSRAHHITALDQLRRLLGVTVFDSVGEFVEFLGGSAVQMPARTFGHEFPVLAQQGETPLNNEDEQLVRYVFRHCRRCEVRPLGGGFSGNLVAAVRSEDMHGHQEAMHVVKIGPRALIGRERNAFESIEEVLGNSAPRITDFADLGGRGIVKYRYASMRGDDVATFRKLYMGGLSPERTSELLETVFVDQLGRLYGASQDESLNLLEYYGFSPDRAGDVRKRVEAVSGAEVGGDTVRLPCGLTAPNVVPFYGRVLPRVNALRRDHVRVAYVHGDLNGANIVVDGHANVWLIDFFHTHRGHILRDLAKLENDLLFIFTPVSDAEALREAAGLSDRLAAIDDLREPLPPAATAGIADGPMARAWETIRVLRGFYPGIIREQADALQWRIAALRYAVHTMSFDESSDLQKQWALYAAGTYARRVETEIL